MPSDSPMSAHRTVAVNAEALARLLRGIDPSGYLSNELGVAWIDDGSGIALKLVEATDAR